MSEHFTRATVEASVWCPACRRDTIHRIDSGQRGPCLVCMAKPTQPKRPDAPPVTGNLFD
jgi:hypothetical protein